MPPSTGSRPASRATSGSVRTRRFAIPLSLHDGLLEGQEPQARFS